MSLIEDNVNGDVLKQSDIQVAIENLQNRKEIVQKGNDNYWPTQHSNGIIAGLTYAINYLKNIENGDLL